MIAVILTYSIRRASGVCGQTAGADGTGDYAVLFEADTLEAGEDACHEYINKLHGASNITVVSARERFLGSPVQVVKC